MTSLSNADNLAEKQAADWCIRLQDGNCTAPELLAFEQWLNSDPKHADEYQKMSEIWNLSAHLTPSASQGQLSTAAILGRTTTDQQSSNNQILDWRLFAKVAALCLFALPIIAYSGWSLNLLPNQYHSYTADNTVRKVILPDNSQVDLNLHTELSFTNYRDRRQVNLSNGEAFFQVAHDKQHPFIVSTSAGTITVTGTQFNVWKYEDNIIVALTEGSVEVDAGHSQKNLKPGLQAQFNRIQPYLNITTFNQGQTLAWRKGQLILDNITLAEAAPKISRYLQAPLVLSSYNVGRLRIGGIYNTNDIESLIKALPKILPVALNKQHDGSIKVSGRHSPSHSEL